MNMRLIAKAVPLAKRITALVAGAAFLTALLTCACGGEESHAQEPSPSTAAHHHHDADSSSGSHGDNHACTCPDLTAQSSAPAEIAKLLQNPEPFTFLAFADLDAFLILPENRVSDHGPPERSPPLFFFSPSFASRAPPALV